MKSTKLRSGYTTGVHTSYAFKSALGVFIACKELSISKTIKMDNDDLDVTKACEIIVSISNKFDDLILTTRESRYSAFVCVCCGTLKLYSRSNTIQSILTVVYINAKNAYKKPSIIVYTY